MRARGNGEPKEKKEGVRYGAMRCSAGKRVGGTVQERSGIRGDISSVVERERRAVGRRESAIRKRHEKLARDRKLCAENARA